ncbi:hypothetical protein GCM10027049_07400 [Mucilaginibacter puniceus]
MTHNKIQVAPFTNTDIKDIIPVHIKAFKGYMNAGMGHRYIQEFLSWFLAYPETITLKAVINGSTCGYVVGAPLGYDKFINKKLLKFVIVGTITHPLVLFHKNFFKVAFRKMILIFTTPSVAKITNPDGKGISLVGIGIDENYAGLGIGQQLMVAFEEKARELGMDFMRLSVYDYNLKAIHVYEKCGWQKLAKKENVFYYFKTL